MKGSIPLYSRLAGARAHGVRLMLLFLVGLLFPTSTTPGQPCLVWERKHNQVTGQGVKSPGQRVHHAMVYDSDRGVMVFFGGETGTSDSVIYYDDTWEYDGTVWKEIKTVAHPFARSLHAMAYDPVGKRVLLYGGFAGGRYGFDDTWQYRGDGENGFWEKIGGSPDVSGHRGDVGARMVWDAGRQKGLRVGGDIIPFDELSPVLGEPFYVEKQDGVVTLEGSSWVAVPGIIEARWGMGLAYDEARQRTVAVGGYTRGFRGDPPRFLRDDRIFEFLPDGTWVQTSTAIPAREYPAMAYDSKRGRLLVVGGLAATEGSDEQAFEYVDGKGWVQGIPLPPGMGRSGAAMAYDSRRGVMVLMGGAGLGAEKDVPGDTVNRGPGSRWSDTWELKYSGSLRFDGYIYNGVAVGISPPPRDWCLTQPYTVYAGITGPCGPVTYQWYSNGNPIPRQTNVVNGLAVLNLPANFYKLGGARHRLTVKVTDNGTTIESNPFEVIVHDVPRVIPDDPILPAGVVVRPSSLDQSYPKYWICPGDSFAFRVQIRSTLPVRSVQWLRNSEVIKTLPGDPGESAIFNLPASAPADSGVYSVRVHNECGSQEEVVGELRVGPALVGAPLPLAADVCKTASFGVVADGKGTLRYQWLLDGQPIRDDAYVRGAASSILRLGPILYAHEGNYSVVVTDDCGSMNSVTSTVAKLTVKPGPQWVLRATNGPPARQGAAMTYDSRRQKMVLFGGFGQGETQLLSRNDLWEWDGYRWTERMTNTWKTNGWALYPPGSFGQWTVTFQGDRPVHRWQHAMTFDERRGVTVVFGGYTWDPGYGGFGGWREAYLNDVWEWNGLEWRFRATNGPSPRARMDMTYDRRRGVALTYGGTDPKSMDLVWMWDGGKWESRQATPPNATYPTIGGSFVYDSFRDLYLFGPSIYCPSANFCQNRAYWTWDGTAWKGAALGADGGVPLEAGVVYDANRRRVVHFGGTLGASRNDLRTWDGENWEALTPAGSLKPAPRLDPAMAYDSERKTILVFGGARHDGPGAPDWLVPNETWELVAVDRPLINDPPPSRYVKAGDATTFELRAVGPPGSALSARVFRNGLPVPDGRGSLKNEAAADGVRFSYTLTNVTGADTGTYTFRITNECGSSDSPGALLTVEPGLQITPLAIVPPEETATASPVSAPTLLFWSDPNGVLEMAPTPEGPWMPVPGATSPFAIIPEEPHKFFRLRYL